MDEVVLNPFHGALNSSPVAEEVVTRSDSVAVPQVGSCGGLFEDLDELWDGIDRWPKALSNDHHLFQDTAHSLQIEACGELVRRVSALRAEVAVVLDEGRWQLPSLPPRPHERQEKPLDLVGSYPEVGTEVEGAVWVRPVIEADPTVDLSRIRPDARDVVDAPLLPDST